MSTDPCRAFQDAWYIVNAPSLLHAWSLVFIITLIFVSSAQQSALQGSEKAERKRER